MKSHFVIAYNSVIYLTSCIRVNKYTSQEEKQEL